MATSEEVAQLRQTVEALQQQVTRLTGTIAGIAMFKRKTGSLSGWLTIPRVVTDQEEIRKLQYKWVTALALLWPCLTGAWPL